MRHVTYLTFFEWSCFVESSVNLLLEQSEDRKLRNASFSCSGSVSQKVVLGLLNFQEPPLQKRKKTSRSRPKVALASQSGVGDPKWGRKLSQMGSQGSAGVAQSKCN